MTLFVAMQKNSVKNIMEGKLSPWASWDPLKNKTRIQIESNKSKDLFRHQCHNAVPPSHLLCGIAAASAGVLETVKVDIFEESLYPACILHRLVLCSVFSGAFGPGTGA